MLLDYSFKNFCSFKDEAEFSMRATEEEAKQLFQENYVPGKVDALKTAVIVGENAGGKSNFVKSLQYLKSFFKSNNRVVSIKNYINDDYTNNNDMKIGDTEQAFSLKVSINNVIYYYDLTIDALGICSESLQICESTEKESVKIFSMERENRNFYFNEPFEEFLNSDSPDTTNVDVGIYLNKEKVNLGTVPILENLLKNEKRPGLFVTKFAILGVEPAVIFTDFMNNKLCVESAPYVGYEFQQDEEFFFEDLKILNDEKYLKILQIIDPSIENIELDKKLPYLYTIIHRKNKNGDTFSRMLALDSAGLRDYFAWAVQIFKVLYQNKILFADEMDRSLNPVLADKIISLIQGSEHQGQFIFTTHNVLHLNLNTLMKEQIYFVTKDLDTLHSELYSLADFPEISYDEDENLYEFYLRGILGGTVNG